MKVYGERLSRTERVLWAADECGLDYDHIPVPVNGDKGEALLATNPDGAIPTLDDDELIVTQSWAISPVNDSPLVISTPFPLFPGWPCSILILPTSAM